MKKAHLAKMMLVAVATIVPVVQPAPVEAQIDIHIGVPGIGIALPPPIVFSAAPTLVALPGSYVYAVPDYGDEIFFVDGYWWRPWQGRWYRSSYYDRDWGHYSGVPAFYNGIPRDWRTRYRSRDWDGRRWDYERVSHDQVQRNWSNWKSERRWDLDRKASYDNDRRYDTREGGRYEGRYEKDRKSAPAPQQRYEGKKGAPSQKQRYEGKQQSSERRESPQARSSQQKQQAPKAQGRSDQGGGKGNKGRGDDGKEQGGKGQGKGHK